MGELLQDVTAAALLGLIAYGSTNLDNLLLLSSMARTPGAGKPLRSGFALATLAILVLCVSFIVLGLFMPASALGYLGVIPITLGVRQLFFAADPAGKGPETAVSTTSVASILIANSSDTLAAFGPLMAESELIVMVTLAITFVVAASATLWLVGRLQAGVGDKPWLDTLAARGTPVIMILVGSYILMNTTTDLV